MQRADQAYSVPEAYVPPPLPVHVIGKSTIGPRWILQIAGSVVVVGGFRAASSACPGSYDLIVFVLQWALFGSIAASLMILVARGASILKQQTDAWLKRQPLLLAIAAAVVLWIGLTVLVWLLMTDWAFRPFVDASLQVIDTLGALGHSSAAKVVCPLPA